MQWQLHIPRVPGLLVPHAILIVLGCDVVVLIIFRENWICLFILENAKVIAYPEGPKTPGPPTHIRYFIFGFSGLDYNLGAFHLSVHR